MTTALILLCPWLHIWQNKNIYICQNQKKNKVLYTIFIKSIGQKLWPTILKNDTWKLWCITAFEVHSLPHSLPTSHSQEFIFAWMSLSLLLLNSLTVTLFTAMYKLEVFVKILMYHVWFPWKKIIKLRLLREGECSYTLIDSWQCTKTSKEFNFKFQIPRKEKCLIAVKMPVSWEQEVKWFYICLSSLNLFDQNRMWNVGTVLKYGPIFFIWTLSDDPRCPSINKNWLFMLELHSNIYLNCWLYDNLFTFS